MSKRLEFHKVKQFHGLWFHGQLRVETHKSHAWQSLSSLCHHGGAHQHEVPHCEHQNNTVLNPSTKAHVTSVYIIYKLRTWRDQGKVFFLGKAWCHDVEYGGPRRGMSIIRTRVLMATTIWQKEGHNVAADASQTHNF